MRSSTVRVADLDNPLILSPERYSVDESRFGNGIALQDLVTISRLTVSPKKATGEGFLIADTAHAEHGILKLSASNVKEVKSSKKLLSPGDVIISRLRPYLRQVAFVDASLFDKSENVACSTEFHVLRSSDACSIAFLTPWLLSSNVQQILQDSVEGAHHPRFSAETLLRLRVPQELFENRDYISHAVEKTSRMFHRQHSLMQSLIEEADRKPQTMRANRRYS